MDIIELLEADHREVEALFKTFAKGEHREEIADRILNALDLHTRLEETLFYPELETASDTADTIRESYEEHRQIKNLIAELRPMEQGGAFDAKMKVLEEDVLHHVEEEEDELFPAARVVLDKDDREMIGGEAEEMKKRLRTPKEEFEIEPPPPAS